MPIESIPQPKPGAKKPSVPRELLRWLLLTPFILLMLLCCGLVSLRGMRPIAGGAVSSNLEVDYAPWNLVAFQPLSTNIVVEILRDLQYYPVETPLPADYLRNPLPSSTLSPVPTDVPLPTLTKTANPPTDIPVSPDTDTPAPTPTTLPTATYTWVPQPTVTDTNQPPPADSDTPPPPPDTSTATQSPSNTPTNTFVPSATPTSDPTSTPTPTVTSIPTATPTPTITSTSTSTATPTVTHTATPTATNTGTSAPLIYPTPGGGNVGCGSPATIDLEADIYVRYLVYYESLRSSLRDDCGFPGAPDVPGICMDWVWVEAGLDGSIWTNYFFWGDVDGGNNGSLINTYAPDEFDNQPFPASELVDGSGIVIPVYDVIHYIRIGTSDCPGAGGDDDPAQVRDLHVYP